MKSIDWNIWTARIVGVLGLVAFGGQLAGAIPGHYGPIVSFAATLALAFLKPVQAPSGAIRPANPTPGGNGDASNTAQ